MDPVANNTTPNTNAAAGPATRPSIRMSKAVPPSRATRASTLSRRKNRRLDFAPPSDDPDGGAPQSLSSSSDADWDPNRTGSVGGKAFKDMDEDVFCDEVEDDDDDDDEDDSPPRPPISRKRSRAVPFASAPNPNNNRAPVLAPDPVWEATRADAVRLNLNYLDTLLRIYDMKKGDLPTYSKEEREAQVVALNAIRAEVDKTHAAVREWGLPVTRRANPVEEIREADGTELRFTTVANGMGLLWSSVPDSDKRKVYERAAELHEHVFGVRPSRVRAWTKTGPGAVYYYTRETAPRTMERAIREYMWNHD